MGINASAVEHGYLTEKEVNMFVRKSRFTKKEIYILASKYREISHDSKIELKDFQKSLNIANKGIADILFKIIDSDNSGEISFTEFIEGLNQFHPDAPFEKKVELCFKAYDSDGSGAVSKDEITNIIQISLENNPYMEFSEAQISELVEGLIKQYDHDGSGELDFHEFYAMLSTATGVIESFDIDVNALCQCS